MDGILRSRRLLTVVLLLLSAAPPGADAQQFVCQPIARSDTASRLARQLTGKADAAYTTAFQIFDPARGMFVPKSHYRRLSTDWQVCVARGPVESTSLLHPPDVVSAIPAGLPQDPPITSAPLALASAPLAFGPVDGAQDGVVFVAKMGAVVVLTLLMCVAAAGSLAPRPIPPVMRRAGEEFVCAFARPLIDSSSSSPPIHARLRFRRRKEQLEISIAPGAGRRYPNLVDHKRNVEYDVHRVMRHLGTHFVVSDRLRAAGKWVVVPIRLAHVKEAGAK
jgi:hypothetical protein